MACRIEVGFLEGITDAPGDRVRNKIKSYLNLDVESVQTIEAYNIDAKFSDRELELIASKVLSDPIINRFSYKAPLCSLSPGGFDWLIEVGFLPGVTDNAGKTAGQAIKDALSKDAEVFTSKQYLIKAAKLTREDARSIASGLLANELIERFSVIGASEAKGEMDAILPKVASRAKPAARTINLNVCDEELMEISKKGVLALSLEEMQAIQRYFRKKGRQPKDAELEIIAQTWSEHCKHKIFNAIIDYEETEISADGTEIAKIERIDSLFSTYIKRSTDQIRAKTDLLVSVFTDNAGIIRFNKDWNIVMKAETHNSPSALDPYGGAMTGIVGVNRDVIGAGMGAKLIANTDVFCFATPFYNKEIPKRLLHPRRVLDGVRLGVEHGGNKSGIPTVNGSLVFDERYLGKPLVYCGTAGIIPAKINGKPTEVKKAMPGDLIVMTGGRVGKDGIHGATFSSEELNESSPATAVQIGDPFTQKKMIDFLLEARDWGLYSCITDNGAGGIASSVGETAQGSGGAEIWLDKVPLKYPGLMPWEILISESQERMSLSVPKKNMEMLQKLADKHEVEMTVIGKYTDSGRIVAKYKAQAVCDLEMDFLHDGLPRMRLKAVWKKPTHPEPKPRQAEDYGPTLHKMLARLNICSKESIVRQYDHEVQGGSVIKPMTGAEDDGPSDAAVFRPLLGSMEGVVISHGIIPRYSDIDTYHMMANSIDEGIRNAVCVGADISHMAGLDNFCWCDPVASEKTPDGEYKLAQLVRANKALYDCCTGFGVPCISGKDSMKNDYSIDGKKISIPPTVLFTVIGKVEDSRRCVTMDAKSAGDLVYALGMTRDELGASEYYTMSGKIGNKVPIVDVASAKRLYEDVHKAISLGILRSCHDCSDGGLAVALAETAFSGGLGMEVDLAKVPAEDIDRDDKILFSESASRFVATVRQKDKAAFEKIMEKDAFALVGEVKDDGRLRIRGLAGKTIIDEDIGSLKASWQSRLAL